MDTTIVRHWLKATKVSDFSEPEVIDASLE